MADRPTGEPGGRERSSLLDARPSTDPEALEAEVRAVILALLPRQQAPTYLRLAFHDAGTYDVTTHTGGAHGAIHLPQELARPENVAMRGCIELLAGVKERYPALSWADLVALAGAAGVAACGGPVIRVGLGRVDAEAPAPEHRLPTTDEGAVRLKAHFAAMGLTAQDLVALSGGHTLGGAGGRPFTPDPLVFSNTYFRILLAGGGGTAGLLPSDLALLDDPELRPFVEAYAADEGRFLADFAAAYRRLTWLGGDPPAGLVSA